MDEQRSFLFWIPRKKGIRRHDHTYWGPILHTTEGWNWRQRHAYSGFLHSMGKCHPTKDKQKSNNGPNGWIQTKLTFLVKVVSKSWAMIIDGCHLFAASRKPIIKPLTHLCIPKNTLDSFLARFGKNWKVSACFYVTNNFCEKCYVDLHLHTLTQPLINIPIKILRCEVIMGFPYVLADYE